MKFFWKHKLFSLFCVVFVIVSFFGISQDTTTSFSAQKAFAQAQQQGTYAYYKGTVDNLYTTTIQALDDNLKKYEGTAEYQTRQKVADSYKQALAISRSAYNTTLSAEQSKGTPAVDAQILALRDLISTNTNSPQVLQLTRQYTSSAEKGYYNEFSKLTQDAMTAAQKIKQGEITAGSQEAQILTDPATIANAGNPNTQSPKVKIDTASKCSLLGEDPFVNCISAGVEWLIKNILLEIAGWFLWLTSEMLNYVISVGILEFKSLSDVGGSLYIIWTIVRKIVSLFVVFVGLWLGFMYILGKEDKFEKYVPWVVIFALFINFSYPLARVAIDVSNVVALKVYVATFGPDVLKKGTTARSAGTVVKEQLGLTKVVKDATGSKFEGKDLSTEIGLKGTVGVPAALLAVAFVFYTAYVFFMVALMLAIRTAILIFMIVMSPFLFVDSILPVLGDAAMKARTVFFSQLAVAPVFMIMLALSLKFMIALNGVLQADKSSSSAAQFMTILLMLVMLKITLKVTRDLSEKAGTSVSNMLGKVGGFATTGALAVATGGAGLAARGALAGSGILARGTVGRAAGRLRDSGWVTKNQDSVIGRRVYDMSNSLAKSSYDLRNSSVVAGGLRNVGIKNIGEGGKLGYAESAEKTRQDILARAERIKTRYERDVVDANGNILHRKGDIDVSGQAAFDRYVEKAGGARFVTEEQKKKTREALAEKQKERSEKYTQESDTLSTKEVSEYNSIQSPQVLTDANGNLKITSVEEQKATYIKELERNLEEYKKTDPELRGTIGRSLLKSLQEIKSQQLKGEIAELQKMFTAIDSDIKNPDGTVSTVQNQRDQVLRALDQKLKNVQGEAQGATPHRRSEDAQMLVGAKVELEKQAKKSDEDFMKKVGNLVDRYKNVEGSSDAEKEKSRAKLLNDLDERMRTTVKQQLRNDGVLAPEKSTILGADGRPLDKNPTGQTSVPAPTPATTPTSTTPRTNPAFFTPQPVDYNQLNTPAVTRKNSQPTVDIDLNTLSAESAEQRAENILADGRPAVARTNKPPVTPLPSTEKTTDWQGENTEVPAYLRRETSRALDQARDTSKASVLERVRAQARDNARKKIEREKETHG